MLAFLKIASFLYADPTPGALQVFLPRPGAKQTDMSGLPAEEGIEEGTWITADPIPGCVVCNIGESQSFFLAELSRLIDSIDQCGRFGRMVCTSPPYTG